MCAVRMFVHARLLSHIFKHKSVLFDVFFFVGIHPIPQERHVKTTNDEFQARLAFHRTSPFKVAFLANGSRFSSKKNRDPQEDTHPEMIVKCDLQNKWEFSTVFNG